MDRAEWACPECESSLEDDGRQLRCASCGKAWPIVDGVPHFIPEFAYWGEISQEQMREVNRAARAGNWRTALRESPDAEVRRASQMMLNLDRANWHWLTNLSPESRVLDLGAGTGTNSHALATYYRSVVAVEPVLERVDFMRQRFAQENLSNVRLIRSSLWKLPFPKQSFDLIAMNGVLEWVPEGSDRDPREIQLEALRRAYSLLRPGGCLYVGIENRTAIGSFLGYRDPHCGIPWVTILPRPLAHWYARRNGAPNGYRNYLYSSRGYRKLMRDAGFGEVEVYVAAPSYNHPRYLIPLEGEAFSYFARNFSTPSGRLLRTLAREVLLKLRLLREMEYSYVVLARKQAR